MMMEPYDQYCSPLVNKMSSEEERYFNIPTERTATRLRDELRREVSTNIKRLTFLKMKIIKIFGLFQKIKKNQD